MKMFKISIVAISTLLLASCKKESSLNYVSGKKCGVIVDIKRCYIFYGSAGYVYTIAYGGERIEIASQEKHSLKQWACFSE
jgi:hypothetical protein